MREAYERWEVKDVALIDSLSQSRSRFEEGEIKTVF